MTANNHDRPVAITMSAERARKIAAGLYGVSELLGHCYAGGNPATVEVKQRRQQCEHVARLFEEACEQLPDAPDRTEGA